MTASAQTTARIGRVLMGLAVLWGIIGLSGVESLASDDPQGRATLRGVEGVSVIIEDLEPEVERAGLTRQQLETDVELRLRHAGIRVLTEEERRRTPGAPCLYVNVNVLLHSDRLVAFSIRVELMQLASLKTDDFLATVSTWSTASTGSIGSARLSQLRAPVRDQVDSFINAYLSVHPRSAGTITPSSTSPRRDIVRQVQERLQTIGFNPGTIDGSMGPQTQQALRWFQNARGLRSTGDIDAPTLNALGIQ